MPDSKADYEDIVGLGRGPDDITTEINESSTNARTASVSVPTVDEMLENWYRFKSAP